MARFGPVNKRAYYSEQQRREDEEWMRQAPGGGGLIGIEGAEGSTTNDRS